MNDIKVTKRKGSALPIVNCSVENYITNINITQTVKRTPHNRLYNIYIFMYV
jgi:hypothetical protein